MRLGNEILLESNKGLLKDKRLGLLAHNASLTSRGEHIADLLLAEGLNLTALFGPEHGFRTTFQDMEEVPDSIDPKTGVKVYSLYGDSPGSLRPTQQMLAEIDTLIIDLQDIGTRYYTYIYTMAFCLEEMSRLGKEVIVCDRPNPINGVDIEGGVVEKGFESFVGAYPLPVRHGMTIGEIAAYLNEAHSINCRLHVIKMEGWRREWFWDDTDIKWTNPSPNMRSLDAALLYPGTCLLEATNVSEGRGTETPFEICGAPWIDESRLKKELDELGLEGIEFSTVIFTPSLQKWSQESCHGLKFRITDRRRFKPVKTGLSLIWALYNHSKEFQWRDRPYEFVSNIPAIDLLVGSDRFRKALEEGLHQSKILESLPSTPDWFGRQRIKHLLYKELPKQRL